MSVLRALSLDASSYERHPLHADDRTWVEKNCYVDLCIELVHALGCEPLAMLGFCAAVDFEGDQFTFFKPSHDEMRALYGVDVQELNVWRPLIEHLAEHVGAGRLVATEADSFWLPDTAGTDYQRSHVKTTIIVAELDLEGKRLGYFHNAGYFTLSGEDYDALLRVGAPPDPTFLPLYAELVKVDRVVRRGDAELARMALGFLAGHLARRPATNPVSAFARRLSAELPLLQQAGLERYHAWAFSTIRQLGAAMELLSLHLEWVANCTADDAGALRGAARSFMEVSAGAKTLILKAARAVNTGKTLDAGAIVAGMEAGWNAGMALLLERLEQ